jgi:hypothetical protein
LNRKQNRQRVLERHVSRLERRIDDLVRLSNRLSWVRLGAFVGAAIATWTAFITAGSPLGIITLFVGLIVFGSAAREHNRINASVTRHRHWLAIKTDHLARMTLDWSQIRSALFSTPRPDHSVELDLDLTGSHGLHRLLDTCVSHEGSARLRDWLATTDPDPPAIQARQALVRELVGLPIFRDKLRMNAMLTSRRSDQRWRGDRLLRWLDDLKPSTTIPAWLLYGLTGLALVNVALFLLSALAGYAPLWRFTALVYAGVYFWYVLRMDDPFSVALGLRDPLYDLQSVLAYLEMYRYGNRHALREVCDPLLDRAQRPSVQLARVTRVIAAASVRRNPPFWLTVSMIIPWDLHVAHWLDQSRAAIANVLPQWLDVWFELEASSALATFAYLNPATTFPELIQGDGAPLFEAVAIGHPLIPDNARVCNDFALADPGDLVLITGSNMSGKSTFLRTLGVNLSLAYAGGTVNAQTLRVMPLRLFTCIRIMDSLTNGISYFYAEVKRLKALLDALEQDHPFPLLFLIDEIFRGTNNRERLIGGRAYIRTLGKQRGAGVLSTHDLELVTLADELPWLRNAHFAEHVAEGRMSFDYRLRPGPCPTTNALKIMQMEGLPVEVETSNAISD